MQDKREHQRVPLNLAVVCKSTDGNTYECSAHDLSLGGMFLTGDWRPTFGEKLTVKVLLPGRSKELELPAVVRWLRPDGFGVKFGLLGAKETHALTRLSAARS